MKSILFAAFLAFNCSGLETIIDENPNIVSSDVSSKSFTLLNDTKESVSIHTGSGFVTLNKGSKTSISCNTGKEVSWAENGKKGSAIFEISDDMCGNTVKLSKYVK